MGGSHLATQAVAAVSLHCRAVHPEPIVQCLAQRVPGSRGPALSSKRGQFQLAVSTLFIYNWIGFAFLAIGNLFVPSRS